MLNEDAGILIKDAETAASLGFSTVPGMLIHSAVERRKPDAFKFKRSGQWVNVPTEEFLLRVEELSAALLALGINPGDRIAIMSENRLEWAIADYAALSISAITVPIYPTLSAPQVEALICDCEPALIFVSTAELLEKVLSIRHRLPTASVVAFEPIGNSDVMHFDTLYELGRQAIERCPGEFHRNACAVGADQVATIIYTSGTSGVPKGAMLTHRNLISNVLATSQRLPLQPGDVAMSFLPLSHIFQRHVDYASFYAGCTIAYAESIGSVIEDMAAVQPTFAAGVPRFFEKVYARVLWQVSRGSAVRRVLFNQALRIARNGVRRGKKSLVHCLADRIVFRKIRERLGGRLRVFISGGAALDRGGAEFFWAAGLSVFGGYGLTETSPVVTLNGPDATRIGSV